jgi:hypothetical protein
MTTIRDFLTERNLEHTAFQGVIEHFGDQMGSESSMDFDRFVQHRTSHIRDVRREGKVVVILSDHHSWDRYMGPHYNKGGIRRSISVSVFLGNRKVGESERVSYVHGGYQTYHLDHPERDFSRIVGWKCEGGIQAKAALSTEKGDTGEVKVNLIQRIPT